MFTCHTYLVHSSITTMLDYLQDLYWILDKAKPLSILFLKDLADNIDLNDLR